jgi:hypothetical protein
MFKPGEGPYKSSDTGPVPRQDVIRIHVNRVDNAKHDYRGKIRVKDAR